MRRHKPRSRYEPGPIVAYDFETTRIPDTDADPASVEPRYITMYGKGIAIAQRVESYEALRELLLSLWESIEPNTRFVGYNSNRFDLRLIMEALAGSRFRIEPFVAKQAGLRGALIARGRKRTYWLDALAMTGLACDLRTFLLSFAPEYPKGTLDFSSVEFDADNPAHVAYAKRDAEGLYYAITRAEQVAKGITGFPLQVTIGNLGIKTFTSYMPCKAVSFALAPPLYDIVRRIVVRGGYCYARRYKGPLWTYDLNQAYAAAMRDCNLPSGRVSETKRFNPKRPGVYRVALSREPLSLVPYVVRDEQTREAVETYGEPIVTWLCSNEVDCLRRHGWNVDVDFGFVWEASFRMRAMVNALERRRAQFAAGTPVNLLCKNVGNNAFGKTLEDRLEGKYVFAQRQPKDALPVCDADGEVIPYLWVRPVFKESRRYYARPQLGAFITSHVRTVLFDAIMLAPEAFVKADTDSVSFTRSVPLPLSSWQYGKWKRESNGDLHIVIGKKVYWSLSKIACKGMRVKELTRTHFERWYGRGVAPVQRQRQLQSWKKGKFAPTFAFVTRKGTSVK